MLGRAQAYTVWPGYVNGISVGHHHDPFHSEESAWYDLVNDSSLPLKDKAGGWKRKDGLNGGLLEAMRLHQLFLIKD